MDKYTFHEQVVNLKKFIEDTEMASPERKLKISGMVSSLEVRYELDMAEGRDKMDKQTAIDLLDNLLGMVEDNHESDYDTAIKMGIDALKEKTQLSEEDATKDATFDCISRRAAINEMKDMYTAAEEWAQGAHDDDTKARAESCMATNVELKLRIEKLPSVQSRWVPCKERLPEENGGYLVTGKRGVVYSTRFENGRWYGGTKPIAWMSLPEPWRGQDEQAPA